MAAAARDFLLTTNSPLFRVLPTLFYSQIAWPLASGTRTVPILVLVLALILAILCPFLILEVHAFL